ncbi:MAG: hypothetical protein JNN20_03065 [Betaproteobacteria bacterium]|nr:hypothetical protein [Betaproteobacteria bacterium]
MRAALLLVLALPFYANSQSPSPSTSAAGASKDALPAAAMDTPAQTAAKKLPKDFVNAKPQRFSAEEKRRVETITRLDEILVEGQIDPEDYVGPKKAPMMQFRDRLEKDRPMTPKEKAQLALCFIGLCGIYGPDGVPVEPSRDAKRDERLNQSTTQLNSQFRGTVQ